MAPSGGGGYSGLEQVVGAAGEAGEAQNCCAPRRSQDRLKGPGTGLGPGRSDAKEEANGSPFNLGVGNPPRPSRDSRNSLQFATEDAFKERITKLKQAALRDAKREGIQLVVAPGTRTGFRGVHFKPSKSKPYQATACGGRKNQHLGHFVTAEEAALCYARHIGKKAAAVAAEKQLSAPPEPTTPAAKKAVAMALAEGLELVRYPSANSGYKGVVYLPHRRKPYQARASCGGGRSEHLGYFDTAEEAALCYTRHERRAATIAALCDAGVVSACPSRSHIHKLAKVAPSPTNAGGSDASADGALLQAKAEGLNLLRACTKGGCKGNAKGAAHDATSNSHPVITNTAPQQEAELHAELHAGAAAGRVPATLAKPNMQPRVPVGMEGMEVTYGIPYGVPVPGLPVPGLPVPGLPAPPAAGGLPGMMPCSTIWALMEPCTLPTMLCGAIFPAGMTLKMPQVAHAAMMPLAAQPGLSGLGSLPGTVPPATAWYPLPPPNAAQAPLLATTTSGLSGPQLQASMGLGETSTALPAAAMQPQPMPQFGIAPEMHGWAGGGPLALPITHPLC